MCIISSHLCSLRVGNLQKSYGLSNLNPFKQPQKANWFSTHNPVLQSKEPAAGKGERQRGTQKKWTGFATSTPFLPEKFAFPRKGGRRGSEFHLWLFCSAAFCFALPLQGSLCQAGWTLHWRSVHSPPAPGRQSGAKCKSRSKFLPRSLLGSVSLILEVL